MDLYQLTFACYIYGHTTSYDASYVTFCRTTAPNLNLDRHEHCASLLDWLNEWGCRQFAKANRDLAEAQIRQWYGQCSGLLPPPGVSVDKLLAAHLGASCLAYGQLVDRVISQRSRDGRKTDVTVGPTGAAKILFALRPEAFPPWDQAIRKALALDGTLVAYRAYLDHVRALLDELNDDCARHGLRLDTLPQLLGRRHSTLVKLMDEYLWVTITRNSVLPPGEELAQWATWRWEQCKADKEATRPVQNPLPSLPNPQLSAAPQSHASSVASQTNGHLRDVRRLYELLTRIEKRVGGMRVFRELDGKMDWPDRGVYFVFESGEVRTTSGAGLRVVRVGTHALRNRSGTTLWKQLREHRGTVGGPRPGGGNHRLSAFRTHVGAALINMYPDQWPKPATAHWNDRQSSSREIREQEYPIECAVSEHIERMSVLWVEIGDPPGPESLRGYIQRNAIALLSNALHPANPIDPPGKTWLGHWADHKSVRLAGLWNVNHVMDDYDPDFLDLLESKLG